MKNLGYANGFGKIWPKEITDCKALNHPITSKKTGNCVWKYSCDKCGYYYKIDSGD